MVEGVVVQLPRGIDTVFLREQPTLRAYARGTVARGDRVWFSAEANEAWYLVYAGGKEGWVSKQAGQVLILQTAVANDSFWLQWPTADLRITQVFGNNPAYYGQWFKDAAGRPLGHEGIDLAAAHGSPITACADGEVYRVETADNSAYGLQVRINHRPFPYRTVYAHLETVAVAVGETVVRGQVIGTADNTGNSFGDHLHLTVKRDGATRMGLSRYVGKAADVIDPLPLLMIGGHDGT